MWRRFKVKFPFSQHRHKFHFERRNLCWYWEKENYDMTNQQERKCSIFKVKIRWGRCWRQYSRWKFDGEGGEDNIQGENSMGKVVKTIFKVKIRWGRWWRQYSRWKFNGEGGEDNIQGENLMGKVVKTIFKVKIRWGRWWRQYSRWKFDGEGGEDNIQGENSMGKLVNTNAENCRKSWFARLDTLIHVWHCLQRSLLGLKALTRVTQYFFCLLIPRQSSMILIDAAAAEKECLTSTCLQPFCRLSTPFLVMGLERWVH